MIHDLSRLSVDVPLLADVFEEDPTRKEEDVPLPEESSKTSFAAIVVSSIPAFPQSQDSHVEPPTPQDTTTLIQHAVVEHLAQQRRSAEQVVLLPLDVPLRAKPARRTTNRLQLHLLDRVDSFAARPVGCQSGEAADPFGCDGDGVALEGSSVGVEGRAGETNVPRIEQIDPS